MEELQLLVGMVSELPSMALWVIAFFFVYKVVIVGSIWGVIKLAIVKAHAWATTPKHKLEIVDIVAKMNEITVDSPYKLITQIERLKGIKSFSNTYIRADDVKWLEEAIDEKLINDKKEEKK